MKTYVLSGLLTVCLAVSRSPCLFSVCPAFPVFLTSGIATFIQYNKESFSFIIQYLLIEQASARLLSHALDSIMRSRIIVLLAVCSNIAAAGPLRHNGARAQLV